MPTFFSVGINKHFSEFETCLKREIQLLAFIVKGFKIYEEKKYKKWYYH